MARNRLRVALNIIIPLRDIILSCIWRAMTTGVGFICALLFFFHSLIANCSFTLLLLIYLFISKPSQSLEFKHHSWSMICKEMRKIKASFHGLTNQRYQDHVSKKKKNFDKSQICIISIEVFSIVVSKSIFFCLYYKSFFFF